VTPPVPGPRFLVRAWLDAGPDGSIERLAHSLQGRPGVEEVAGFASAADGTGLLLCSVTSQPDLATTEDHVRARLAELAGSGELADSDETASPGEMAGSGTVAGSGRVAGYVLRGGAIAQGPGPLASAGVLFAMHLQPATQWYQALTEWLHGEHFARQSAMPGVAWGLGYESVAAPTAVFNLWSVAREDVVDSPEWLAVRNTEWWDRISGAFASGPLRRAIYRRVLP
jgi:hypothetical protein